MLTYFSGWKYILSTYYPWIQGISVVYVPAWLHTVIKIKYKVCDNFKCWLVAIKKTLAIFTLQVNVAQR